MSVMPHLVQYQGSKRNLANKIISYIPRETKRIIEPFSGTAAITIACASNEIGDEYLINDLNEPLIKLLENVVNSPEKTAKEYEIIWKKQLDNPISYYYDIRETFNSTHNPVLFLYLLARCVKGSVRYNSAGQFNQSPDKRRKGTCPDKMAHNIFGISSLLKGKVVFSSVDYKQVLEKATCDDVVYMDPPYQGVCGDKDSRYYSGINHFEFIEELRNLKHQNIPFIVSYDGKMGNKEYGNTLPADLQLEHIYINAGRSSQATLLGRNDETIESLYVSKKLCNSGGCENQYELFERIS